MERWITSHFPLLFTARVNCDFVVIKKQELVFCALTKFGLFCCILEFPCCTG